MGLVSGRNEHLPGAGDDLLAVHIEGRLAPLDHEHLRMRMEMEPDSGTGRVVNQEDRERDSRLRTAFEKVRRGLGGHPYDVPVLNVVALFAAAGLALALRSELGRRGTSGRETS